MYVFSSKSTYDDYVEKPVVTTVSRKKEGGDLVLLRVSNHDLENPNLQLAMDKFSLIGVVPGPKAYLFQVSEGNYQDFSWYVLNFLHENVRMTVRDSENLVIVESWTYPNQITKLVFRFALTPISWDILSRAVRSRLGVN